MSHGHYSDRIPYSGYVLSASTHLPRDSRHQLRAPSQTSITPNEQRRRTRITPRAPLENLVSSRSTLHDVSASAPSEGPSEGHGRQPRRPLPAVPNKPAAPRIDNIDQSPQCPLETVPIEAISAPLLIKDVPICHTDGTNQQIPVSCSHGGHVHDLQLGSDPITTLDPSPSGTYGTSTPRIQSGAQSGTEEHNSQGYRPDACHRPGDEMYHDPTVDHISDSMGEAPTSSEHSPNRDAFSSPDTHPAAKRVRRSSRMSRHTTSEGRRKTKISRSKQNTNE